LSGWNKAKKVQADGITFDSTREYHRYLELRVLQKAGIIRNLKAHTKHRLELDGRPLLVKSDRYPNGRRASYTDDFSYEAKKPHDQDHPPAWEKVVEDVKGRDTTTMRYRRGVFELLTGQKVTVIK